MASGTRPDIHSRGSAEMTTRLRLMGSPGVAAGRRKTSNARSGKARRSPRVLLYRWAVLAFCLAFWVALFLLLTR